MNDPSANSTEKLLILARAGDSDALQELLCEHFDRLLRHIEFRMGKGATVLASDDILQDAFVHAVRDIGKCRATTDISFFAWLKQIADNRFRDALKSSKAQKRGGDRIQIRAVKIEDASALQPLVELLSASIDTPSVDAASDEAIKAVQVGLCAIPDDQRLAIQLRHIEGLSLEDVANEMNKSEAAVRGLIHRGKQALLGVMGNSSRWFVKK